MKKTIAVILSLICVLCLFTACGEKTDLLPKASPETSGLGVYSYTGDDITLEYLFGTDEIKDVLKDFNGIDAKKTDIDKATLKPPFYGVEIGGKDGFTVYGLWADGYFIKQDGSTYEFDYDFEKLLGERNFEELGDFEFLSVLPLSYMVARSENGWNKEFLTVSGELPENQEGVFLTLKEQTDEYIVGLYENTGKEDFGYGHAFSLDVQIDGVWFRVPPEKDIAFTEELMMIMSGGESEEKFYIAPYGDLPKGLYRINNAGYVIEFSI